MGIQAKPDQFEKLENLLKDFIAQRPQTITSPKDLAVRMAGKANLIKDVLANTLRDDDDQITELAAQYEAFKENLIHDITKDDFADIYAETIAYGMFAARLHDTTLDTFSRQEALELLPKSNPFLRSLFSYVAGYDLDERIAWIIDDLARVFRACDVTSLMEGFGKLTGQNDPFLHFYETFLAAYNPAKRKARGVWYTPEPVVNFIVRAVDEVLQTEFGLPDGLADTSKVTIDWDTGQTNKKGKAQTIKKEVHRVQILDPATGTGTFLAEVIKQIAPKIKGVAPGMWSQYIEDDLIPRLHGFELLMASYAMCHMKIDMILTELGYKPTKTPPRLGVYLTNSLEEGEPANQTLPFTQWLSREAKGANTIKRDMPIMCVIGNPPYSVSSTNSSHWINTLMFDYKRGLEERNIQPLSDDYIKFIRFSQHFIDKNGEGVLGLITNNSFLDGIIHRKMRESILESFDRIYVLDLHGNAKKREVTEQGNADKNVFDIMQGVSIIVAYKKQATPKQLAEVFHGELRGSRESKYSALETGAIDSNLFQPIETPAPHYFFVPKDFSGRKEYETGFVLPSFWKKNACGIVSARDSLLVKMDDHKANSVLSDLQTLTVDDFRAKHPNVKDSRDWTVERAILDAQFAKVHHILYRPFDVRSIPYSKNSKGVVSYPRFNIMRHIVENSVLSLLVCKQQSTFDFQHVLATNLISDKCTVSSQTKEAGYQFPLYLYPDEQDLDQSRRVNFDEKLWKKLQKRAKHPTHGTPDEVQTFDYIYGVLHCPAYRDTYAEFLKIDFPRIPWPSTPAEFWDVSAKGSALRKLHLMEPAAIGDTPYPYLGEGDNMVDKPAYAEGKVWINKDQYFDNAPEISWGFYIGGYQPSQKWLKDRKGRTLNLDDVRHYQRILKILCETDRIMKTIDMDLG